MKRIIGLASLVTLLSAGTAFAQGMDQSSFDKFMDSYLQSRGGPEKIANAIQEHFNKKQQEAQQSELDTQFKNPVKIEIGASPVKGLPTAKVTIIEYSDFQCPFCRRGRDTMLEVTKLYPNDVKLVFKNLPLPMHKEATPSAKAALAANKQGKFWEFHDALFDNQDKLNAAFYEETAKRLGLDLAKFKTDMASEEIAQQIKEEAEVANKLGINGTPGFFVNGVAVRGAYPVNHFKMLVDRWLKGDSASAAAQSGDSKKS